MVPWGYDLPPGVRPGTGGRQRGEVVGADCEGDGGRGGRCADHGGPGTGKDEDGGDEGYIGALSVVRRY